MKKILLIVCVLVVLALGFMGFSAWQTMKGEPSAQTEEKYQTSADRYIDLDGARVRVRDEGPKDGEVIILIHGFSFSLESFDAWADVLKKDYRVIRYDLMGHGLTGPDPKQRYAPKERTHVLHMLMEELGIEKATIAGNSLGGLVAWRLASHHPEMVERLILVDAPAYPFNGTGAEPQKVPTPIKVYFLTAPEPQVRASLGLIYNDPSIVSEERFQLLHDMMRREGNPQAFVDHLEEFVMPDPAEELAAIKAPTLILWGEEDKMISIEQGRQMEKAIQNARLITYPNIGHVPHEEAAEESVNDVLSFLTE